MFSPAISRSRSVRGFESPERLKTTKSITTMVASNIKFYVQDNRVLGLLREYTAQGGVEWVKVMAPNFAVTFAVIKVTAKKKEEIEFRGSLYITECRAAGIDPEKMKVFARNCADKETRPFLTACTWSQVVNDLPSANPWDNLEAVKAAALHIIAPCKPSEYSVLCTMLDEGEWVYFNTNDLVEILEADRNNCRAWRELRAKLYDKIYLRLSFLYH